MLITNNKRHSFDMNAAYHIIQYFSESSMKDLSSRFSQSFGLLLFQIFSEICQSHITLRCWFKFKCRAMADNSMRIELS